MGVWGERLDTNYLGSVDNMNEIVRYKQLAPMYISFAIHEFRFLYVLLYRLLVLRLLV
jgi:hypothetical protein